MPALIEEQGLWPDTGQHDQWFYMTEAKRGALWKPTHREFSFLDEKHGLRPFKRSPKLVVGATIFNQFDKTDPDRRNNENSRTISRRRIYIPLQEEQWRKTQPVNDCLSFEHTKSLTQAHSGEVPRLEIPNLKKRSHAFCQGNRFEVRCWRYLEWSLLEGVYRLEFDPKY